MPREKIHEDRNLYKNNWRNENKEQINIVVDKGQKSGIKVEAEKVGQSLNAYIVQAITERMERDKVGDVK